MSPTIPEPLLNPILCLSSSIRPFKDTKKKKVNKFVCFYLYAFLSVIVKHIPLHVVDAAEQHQDESVSSAPDLQKVFISYNGPADPLPDQY